jgi:rhodanese-related sulfurtransferase
MRATVIIVGVEIPTVTMDELRRKLDTRDSFVLVDALAPMVYAHSHLPGAINLPPVGLDPEHVLRRIADRNAEIIVYCTSPDCDDSIQTARRLLGLGYTNVSRYAGGKHEWRDAGLPLERAGRPFAPRGPSLPRSEEPPGRLPQR